MLATSGSGKTSSRCWTHKPEGLTTVSLWNDLRTEKSGCSAIVSVVGTTRTTDLRRAAGVFCFQKLPCVLVVWSNAT